MATLQGELNSFLASIRPATFKIGEFIKNKIQERTLAGGLSFPANDYVSRRHIRRRTKRGLQTGFVDLSFTGRMLGSMQVMDLKNDASYEPAGVGSKVRGAGGRFARAEDVEIMIGWPGAEASGFNRNNPGYIANIHSRGYYGPATKGIYPRPFMQLDDLIVQEAMSAFGTSLYKMRNTREVINVGRV